MQAETVANVRAFVEEHHKSRAHTDKPIFELIAEAFEDVTADQARMICYGLAVGTSDAAIAADITQQAEAQQPKPAA